MEKRVCSQQRQDSSELLDTGQVECTVDPWTTSV